MVIVSAYTFDAVRSPGADRAAANLAKDHRYSASIPSGTRPGPTHCECTVISAVINHALLSVGLKVDAEALHRSSRASERQHQPEESRDHGSRYSLNAVVGIENTVETIDGKDMLTHVG